MQLVIAGKAHPADDGGKRLVQQIVRFADTRSAAPHRLPAGLRHGHGPDLLRGCDVWLNNPLRPLEACGTSGMKSALNGGLNLSIRDGWWDEWFDGENGWAIPTADGVEDPDRRDELEAAALYDLIEHKVAPRFYDTARTGCQAAGSRWCGTRSRPRPEGAGRPDGAGLRRGALPAGRPLLPCAHRRQRGGGTLRRRPGTRDLEAAGRPGRGAGSPFEHVEGARW